VTHKASEAMPAPRGAWLLQQTVMRGSECKPHNCGVQPPAKPAWSTVSVSAWTLGDKIKQKIKNKNKNKTKNRKIEKLKKKKVSRQWHLATGCD